MPLSPVYIDQNLIHYHSLSRFPSGWDSVAEGKALDALLAKEGVRFAVSFWTLIEIAKATNSVDQYLAFLDKINPLWMSERLTVQRKEVENFVYVRVFGSPLKRSLHDFVFNPYFSMATATIPNMREKVFVAETAKAFVENLRTHRGNLRALERVEAMTPRAIEILRDARKDKVAWEAKLPEIMKKWFEGLIPERDPEGHFIVRDKKLEVIDFCLSKFDDLLVACPAVATEHYVDEFVFIENSRKATNQDSADMIHMVLGLPYCKILASNDKRIVRTGKFCQAKMKASAHTVCSLSEAVRCL
jgi:hypothetical protein